jgi:uncharacterized protein (DUF305 family)
MQKQVMMLGKVTLLALLVVMVGRTGGLSAHHGTPTLATPAADPCEELLSSTPPAGEPTAGNADEQIIAPFDLTYLDAMIAHAEGSATLAEVAVSRAEHDELKQAARSLADTLTSEASALRSLRGQWYPGAPAVPLIQTVSLLDEALAGVGASADSGMGVSSPLDAATDVRVLCEAVEPFDQQFLEVMTRRFYGDIGLAELALARAEHPELRTIAEEIGAHRQAALLQFAGWSAEWEAESGTPTGT